MTKTIKDAAVVAKAFAQTQEEIRRKRDKYWSMLYNARSDFLKLTDQTAISDETGRGAFFYYLQNTYGLQVEIIDGNIAGDYIVVDEKKYLIFLLRYG